MYIIFCISIHGNLEITEKDLTSIWTNNSKYPPTQRIP